MRLSRFVGAIALGFLALGVARSDDWKLKIVAFNDFHGNLQSPGKIRANTQSPLVPVGGADYLASYVARLKNQNPNNIVVAAGDLIGASPLVSSLFDDEDTIAAMNRIGLDLSSVGNHEFDKGKEELLRMQRGGCATSDQNSCRRPAGDTVRFGGAKFEYLAANVVDTSTGETLLPAYAVKSFQGVPVAFIGLTLKDTPTIVSAAGIRGLRFDDEATTINRIVARLRGQGIRIFVVLIHQGGRHSANVPVDINDCEAGLQSSPIASIVSKLDDGVDLVVSGHTHEAYVCRMPNRSGRQVLVTSAGAFGELLTDIDMTIDPATKQDKSVTARNILVERTTAGGMVPNAALQRMTDQYLKLAAPIANRKVGAITADATKTASTAGETPLGDLVADAELYATRAAGPGGAVAAFMNMGGIRTAIPFDPGVAGMAKGAVTYGELFSVQPFGNSLITMTLTGAQIKTLLEEQFKGCAAGFPAGVHPPDLDRPLQVSEGFSYVWKESGALCGKVDLGSIRIGGQAISPSATYRVTVNSFMADGGDEFYVLKNGADRVGGPQDLDAMTAYFGRGQPVTPPTPQRVSMKP
jgi:5'-nucleotidase